METSAVQALKLVVISVLGLSRDAVHVYIGLGLFLLAMAVCRRRPISTVPLLTVVIVACLGEVLDMRDDLNSLGHWRWRASLHDVVNTLFWPVVLYGLMRWNALFARRNQRCGFVGRASSPSKNR